MTFGVDVSPRNLSATERAPIALDVIAAIRTTDLSNPPALERLILDLDKDSSINGSRLPRCEEGLTPQVLLPLAEIKERCEHAIVGGGRVGFGIVFPGDKALPAESELVIFNGGSDGGGTKLYAYAQIAAPIVSTIVLPIEFRKGGIGTKAIVTVPKIAGGAGFIADLRMRLRRRLAAPSRMHGPISLKCSDGSFLVRAAATFDDGTRIQSEVPTGCRAKRELAR